MQYLIDSNSTADGNEMDVMTTPRNDVVIFLLLLSV